MIATGVDGNARVAANTADLCDSPKPIIVGQVVNAVDGPSHSKIIADRRLSFANTDPRFAFDFREPARIRE